LIGIAALTCYKVQAQNAAAPTFTTPTAGSAVPAGWSATPPAVTIGQVMWYLQGRFNANASTVDGVGANSTAWTGPIAASIFQSIRSDNYNGPTPPTTANFGSAGWYLDQPSGNLFANAAYLRGELVTGVSNAQRIEINKTALNKVAVYNTANQLLGYFGGTGSDVENILQLSPQFVVGGLGYSFALAGQVTLPNYAAPNYQVYGLRVRTTDLTFVDAQVGSWDSIANVEFRSGLMANIRSGGGLFPPFYGGNIGYKYGATVAGGRFYGGTAGSLEVLFADANYAINVTSGTIRYGNVTFSAFPNNANTFLRGDGTFVALPQTLYGNDNNPVNANSSANLYLQGSANTDIAGAYVRVDRGNADQLVWKVVTASPSDRRIKQDIAPIDYGLDLIKALNPVTFRLRQDPALRCFGFISDEVRPLVGDGTPLVMHDPRAESAGIVGHDTIHYASYIPILVRAVQELEALVAALQQALAEK